VLEGRLRPDLPLEIALYDDFISQLECELACSKEKERDLIDKWHKSAKKSMKHLQRKRELKTINRELDESLRRKAEELDGLLAKNRRLNETVSSKQNAVNFSRSHLEKVQHENDDLRLRICRLGRAIAQRG